MGCVKKILLSAIFLYLIFPDIGNYNEDDLLQQVHSYESELAHINQCIADHKHRACISSLLETIRGLTATVAQKKAELSDLITTHPGGSSGL